MDDDYQQREATAVEAIKAAIPKQLKRDMLPGSKGMFCELYANDSVFPNHFLATACDGVGTKLIVAEAMEKYDTVGIDLVAMNANDLATIPQMSPFMFINYIACQAKFQEKKLTADLVRGMAKGLEECDAADILKTNIHVNLGKGETASVDELISGIRPGHAFDVAASMIGFVPKASINHQVKAGDKIIALASSGFHSNGYTDVRHRLLSGDFETRAEHRQLYKGRFKLGDDFEGSTIGDAILEPTRLYVRPMASVSSKFKVAGVNNTGYGLKNLNRISGFNFRIDNPMAPLPIFSLIQKEAKFTDEEMYKKFNMGMGFFMIAPSENADDVLQAAEKFCKAAVVGTVEKGKKESTVTLIKNNKKNNLLRLLMF